MEHKSNFISAHNRIEKHTQFESPNGWSTARPSPGSEHINRFGDYTLNLGRKPPKPDYGYTLGRATSAA